MALDGGRTPRFSPIWPPGKATAATSNSAAKKTPRMKLVDEVKGGRKDFGRWMREREPRGLRGGTVDFWKNVTVVREEAGRLAAEADRRELGDEEFEKRREMRRKRFGPVEAGPSRRDSGIASLGEETTRAGQERRGT